MPVYGFRYFDAGRKRTQKPILKYAKLRMKVFCDSPSDLVDQVDEI